MNISRLLVLAGVVSFVAAISEMAGSPERPPATIAFDANSDPFWISAAAATAPDGSLAYEVFPAGVREVVRAYGDAERCRLVIAYTDEPLGGGPSAGRVKVKDGVLTGRVTAVTEGFLQATPASILTVHVDEVLRDPAGVSTSDNVFVPYYAADFTIGERRFCSVGFPRNGVSFVPQPGDRVLIRFSGRPIGHYINAQDRQLFFGRDGQLYLPRRLPAGLLDAHSFSDLVQRVRVELAGDPK